MRTAKLKIVLLALVVIAGQLFGANIAYAEGITVEVNSGNAILLRAGETIKASGVSGIPVTVKHLPNTGPGSGLAGFEFRFSWDKNIIRVDSIHAASSAGWPVLLTGEPNNVAGTVTATGFTTLYSTADVTLLYIGITAVGKAGQSATLGISYSAMADGTQEMKSIPATAVNAIVKISPAKLVDMVVSPSEQSISEGATAQFQALGAYDDGTRTDITNLVSWSSSNEAVAAVRPSGAVDASSIGTATITAFSGSLKASAKLTVIKKDASVPPSPPPTISGTPLPPIIEQPPSDGKPAVTTPGQTEQPATPDGNSSSPSSKPDEQPAKTPFSEGIGALPVTTWLIIGGAVLVVAALAFVFGKLLRR